MSRPTVTRTRLRPARLPDARGRSGRFVPEPLMAPTGVRAALPPDLAARLRALRGITTRPIRVGFGMGTPEPAAPAGALADGVLVGSALVAVAERHAGTAQLGPRVGDLVAALKAPLGRG